MYSTLWHLDWRRRWANISSSTLSDFKPVLASPSRGGLTTSRSNGMPARRSALSSSAYTRYILGSRTMWLAVITAETVQTAAQTCGSDGAGPADHSKNGPAATGDSGRNDSQSATEHSDRIPHHSTHEGSGTGATAGGGSSGGDGCQLRVLEGLM